MRSFISGKSRSTAGINNVNGGSDAIPIGQHTTFFSPNYLRADEQALIPPWDIQYDGLAGGGNANPLFAKVPVDPNFTSSLFFDPKTKYIWALALDKEGRLYVATGDRGEIFRVAKTGPAFPASRACVRCRYAMATRI